MPTNEQIAIARQYVASKIESDPSLYGSFVAHLDTLLAATGPQLSNPRPDNHGERSGGNAD